MMLSFLFFLSSVAIQDAWYQFHNEAGRFSIDTPYKLQEKIIRATTDIGPLEFHNFYRTVLAQDSLQVEYRVSYVDYPLDFNVEDSTELIQSLLESTIEESVLSVQGDLLYANDDYSYQLPGKVWRIHYNDGQNGIRAKACIRDNRFYLLQALFPLDKNGQVNDHFFKSFRLE